MIVCYIYESWDFNNIELGPITTEVYVKGRSGKSSRGGGGGGSKGKMSLRCQIGQPATDKQWLHSGIAVGYIRRVFTKGEEVRMRKDTSLN